MASDNLSPKDVQHILNSNRCEIVSAIKMNIRSLLDYLIEDHAVSPQVYDRIKAEKVPLDQARDLLDHVSSVGEKAFLSLKRGLIETKCDSLLETIQVEEEKRKKEKVAENRASWPAPKPSNSPSVRPKSWASSSSSSSWKVRELKARFEVADMSAHSYSKQYSGRTSKDDGHSNASTFTPKDMCGSSEPFKGDRCTQQGSASVADSSVPCNMMSSFSEDNGLSETKVKEVADSLNDLNIGCIGSRACSNIPQVKPVNMLLVGCKGNGKSSTGNSILDKTCFMSKRRGGTSKASFGAASFQGQCEDVVWDVNVVDTPGISQEMTKSELTEMVKGVKMLSSDVVCSTSLARSPGKVGIDAIVLTWSYEHTDTNVERECHAFESLHRLFGDALYEHLVIVVTRARRLVSVEDYIEDLPEPLREIEEKCSGRLVTFENDPLEDVQQSRVELCNIAYSLSNENRHRYTVLDLSPMCIIPKGSELRLALMGKTGVGKSSTGNSILGCKTFDISCSAAPVTFDCVYRKRKEPRRMAVVDCPGVLFTGKGVYEEDRLTDQLSRIATIYHTKGLHSMLLVISGKQRFTQEDKDTVQVLHAVFGDRLLQDYTIIVITGKDEIESDKMGDIETYLGNAPEDMQHVLQLCKNRVVFFNNKTRDETIQRMQLAELIRMIDDLVQTNGGPYVDENFEAGRAIAEKIEEARSKRMKAKSTSHLPSTRLTSLSEDRRHSVEGVLKEASPDPIEHVHSDKHEVETSVVADDEVFVDEEATSMEIKRGHELLRRQTRSLVEDQLCASGIWQTQESVHEHHRGTSASPLFPREIRENAFRDKDSDAVDPDVAEERVRRVSSVLNLRMTRLWKAIRKKLSRKRNTVTPALCWTGR